MAKVLNGRKEINLKMERGPTSAVLPKDMRSTVI